MKILLVAFLLAAAACTQVTTPLSPTGIEPGAYANDLVIAASCTRPFSPGRPDRASSR